MDVLLPDGTLIKDVPEGTSKMELANKLKAKGHDVSDLVINTGKSVPNSPAVKTEQPKEEGNFLTRKLEEHAGAGETALSMLTGATTGLLGRAGGALGGIAGSIATGKFGTQEGAQMAAQTAEEGAQRFTYEPKTETGKKAMEAIGRIFDQSKLGGLGPTEALAAQATMTSEAAQAARTTAQGARDAATRGPRARLFETAPEGQMVGMGAASTAADTLRRQRAQSLPVPIDLTEGQATRNFAQQQFEREAAKSAEVGQPLRQRFEQQNQQILQNFDSWIDQTGAEGGSLRAVGESVTDALVSKSNKAKAEIRAAYDKAKESGAMQERIDVAPIAKYLEDHQAEAINAPVLTSVEARLKYIEKNGTASIGDLEELRKMVGRLGMKDATNGLFANEVKQTIDAMTADKGGALYKQARSLRHRYGQEFEDHAVIERLLSNKPGTRDRSVAYEDVFAHSILKGSLDDVETVKKSLLTAGEKGEQAWKELQGSTIRHIRDEITNGVQIDSAGRQVISPAKLNRLVTELDKDGKLDFIFGKQGAQQIRDVNGIAQDAFTAPPGSVNHSNTASILTAVLDKVASSATGIPFAGQALNYAKREVTNAADRKRVQQALQKK